MRTILDVSSQRLIKILELMLLTEQPLTIKGMSTQLNVSEKTINDDLKHIKETWGDTIGIKTSSALGTTADNLSVSLLTEIESQVLLNSVPIMFIEALIWHPHHDLNYYADLLHVSRSTLYRYLPKMNEYLNQLDICIERKLSLYYLDARNELSIRKFITSFLIDISGSNYSMESIVSRSQKLFLEQRIHHLFKLNKTIMPEFKTHYYVVLYCVAMLREQQGFTATCNHLFNGKHLELSDGELTLYVLKFPHLTKDIVNNIEASLLLHRANCLTIKNDANLNWQLDMFLISTLKKLKLPDYEQDLPLMSLILKELYITEQLFPVPHHVLSNRLYFFSKQTEAMNPDVYQKFQLIIHELSDLTHVDYHKHFHYLIHIMLILFPNIIHTKIRAKVYIVSDHSTKHAEFMMNTIMSQLNIEPTDKSDFICVSCSNIDELVLDESHIIITNSSKLYQKQDTLLVNDFPTALDIKKVRNALS